jgi:MFS family permease
MTSAVLGGALGQWPLGLWSDRVDRRWVIGFAALAGLLVGLTIGLSFEALPPLWLMLLGGAWGGVAFPLYAVSVAHTNDHAQQGEYVMISSGLLLMYGIGAILGPFMASLAMQWVGAGGLFLFGAMIHLLLLAYVGLRLSRRGAPPEEEQGKFVDALAGTQTASHVYEDEFDTEDRADAA